MNMLPIIQEINAIEHLKPSEFGFKIDRYICRVFSKSILKLLHILGAEEVQEKEGVYSCVYYFDEKRRNSIATLKDKNITGIGYTKFERQVIDKEGIKFLEIDGKNYRFEYYFEMPSGDANSLCLDFYGHEFWEDLYNSLRRERYSNKK